MMGPCCGQRRSPPLLSEEAVDAWITLAVLAFLLLDAIVAWMMAA
jgi:hypothetical protein